MRNFKSDQSGFTLIDVSIALMVIGLLVAPLVHTYSVWKKDADRGTTIGNLNTTNDAIRQFYFENERYPCPADPTLNPNSPNYGLEDCTGANPNILVAAVADANGDFVIDNVWTGMVPFQSLKMNPEEALDGWEHKNVYAVTDLLTTTATFDATDGLISITQETQPLPNQCGGPEITTTGIHFALFSIGPDGVGGYNENGNLIAACPGDGATEDQENCDGDALFTFPTCKASEVAGNTFYNDIFYTQNLDRTTAPQSTWAPGVDPNNVGTSVGYVGIGNENPQAELDVIGDIRATSDPMDADELGRAYASEYCNADGSNCFEPESIAGYDPNMSCDNDQGMRGIGSNAAKCLEVIPSATAASCPSGQFISQITAAGAIVCSAP